MKKTIVHIIYDLGRGGAETMLVATIRQLKEYNNIVVTMKPENRFGNELECDGLYCLNLNALWQLPLLVPRFRKILKMHKADMVHSHLFWPTLLARMATPKSIPLLTTIHAFIATSVEYSHRHIRFLDKLSYRFRKSIIIVVAKGALEEYFSFLHLKPYKVYALYTFVDVNRFKRDQSYTRLGQNPVFRMITVGALREQKNHIYLLKAFEKLKGENIELDIYGSGPLQNQLQQYINDHHINVHLRGEVRGIEKLIPQYDLYVMSSTFEGFSLSVLEAMALEMPLLLSDVASFREQCVDTAEYFSLKDTDDFISRLKQLKSDPGLLSSMAQKAKARVLSNFTLEHYMSGLRRIYSEAGLP